MSDFPKAYPAPRLSSLSQGGTCPPACGATQGGLFSRIKVGDRILFWRSPEHEMEEGFVWARQYGTRVIEVVDMGGKALRLTPGTYAPHPEPTHGFAPARGYMAVQSAGAVLGK